MAPLRTGNQAGNFQELPGNSKKSKRAYKIAGFFQKTDKGTTFKLSCSYPTMSHIIKHTSGIVERVYERGGKYFADIRISYSRPYMPEISRVENMPLEEGEYHILQRMLEEKRSNDPHQQATEGFRLDINLEGRTVINLTKTPLG